MYQQSKILRIFFIILYLQIPISSLFSQDTGKNLTLDEVIQIAVNQSPDAYLAKHRFRASYWRYRSHIAQFLPSLKLSTTLVDINRSISRITLQDGSDAFVERKLNNSLFSLNVNQNIGFTGGQIFLSSDLQRIDLFTDEKTISYLSTPISIGLSQPLFAFNKYKWEKKVEPLRYEEAKKEYISAVENVKIKAVTLFFELALAQQNLRMAEINFQNNDTLYKIAQGRYNIGTIAQNEVMQMELNYLNSKTDLTVTRIDLEVRKANLRSFLGYNEKININLLISSQIPKLEIDVNKAIELAKTNNSNMLSLERQQIEAQSEVARARTENRFNANLYATYGLTQSGADLQNAYYHAQDQQRVRVGVEIPIVDWGLGRGQYKMAQSNQEVVNITVAQAKTDFEQEIFLTVMQFNLQDDQLLIALKKDTIGQNRYEVTKQRFLIGKVDVLNLNIALTDKDLAKREFISALKNYWLYYYTIRKITLYDFEKQATLIFNEKDLL
jgi:outer membrane protein TolC